jgi:hypothetical protein
MKRVFTAALTTAALALACSGAAFAQDKKAGNAASAQIKVILENEKVRVFETTYAPGAENSATNRATYRVVRALTGGTLERTYADGKKEKVVYKTGEVHVNEPGPTYSTKNIGGKAMKLYTVQVK